MHAYGSKCFVVGTLSIALISMAGCGASSSTGQDPIRTPTESLLEKSNAIEDRARAKLADEEIRIQIGTTIESCPTTLDWRKSRNGEWRPFISTPRNRRIRLVWPDHGEWEGVPRTLTLTQRDGYIREAHLVSNDPSTSLTDAWDAAEQLLKAFGLTESICRSIDGDMSASKRIELWRTSIDEAHGKEWGFARSTGSVPKPTEWFLEIKGRQDPSEWIVSLDIYDRPKSPSVAPAEPEK